MNQPEMAREPNHFEQTEDRIHHLRERVAEALITVRKCVDELDGSEPQNASEAKASESPSTIFGKIGTALLMLENTTSALEHEVGRLRRIF